MPEVATKRIRIAHLYPEAMDLYGDNGNVLALRRRCEWRDIEADVLEVRVGDRTDLSDADVIVMGGGQDAEQAFVASDLTARAAQLRDLVDAGAAALVICGGFQLFGLCYETSSGQVLPGIGVFDAWTEGGQERLIGDVTIEASLRRWGAAHSQPPLRLVGFENHAGVTHLGASGRPLGHVIRGAGNLGNGTTEGAVYRNAIGTYLHGPLLPKNPKLADHLIVAALAHRYGHAEPLTPLDDALEMQAHSVAAGRSQDDGRVGAPRKRLAG